MSHVAVLYPIINGKPASGIDAETLPVVDPSTRPCVRLARRWFDISGTASVSTAPMIVNANSNGGSGLGGRDAAGRTTDQTSAATSLCAAGSENGIDCAVVAQPGKHDWPFAAHAFAAALPWMAAQLGTPGVPAVTWPAPAPPPPAAQAAAK